MAVPPKVMLWQSLANQYAQSSGILDPLEILAIIWQESSGNATAVNPGDPSWGLMQVTMLIAKHYGGVEDFHELFDPETNIRCGSAFLADLKRKYSATNLDYEWVAPYNCGEGQFLRGFKDPLYVSGFRAKIAELRAASTDVPLHPDLSSET